MESNLHRIDVRSGEARTLSYWHAIRNDIDMNPPYQRRGAAWNSSEQAFLLDSIINGFSMPQIYLLDFNTGRSALSLGKYQYAVIDGKQRLTALFAFMDNLLRLNQDFIYLPDPSLRLAGLTLAELQTDYPRLSTAIEQYNLPVASVSTDSEERVRQLFLRLNSGKALNGAELRNSFGNYITLSIDNLASHPFWQAKTNLRMDRMQSHNLVAKLLILECFGPIDTTKSVLDRFAKNSFVISEAEILRAADSVRLTLDGFYSVFSDKDPVLKQSGILTIYYLLYHDMCSRRVVELPQFYAFIKFLHGVRRMSLRELSEMFDQGPQLFELISRFNYINRSGDSRSTINERLNICREINVLFQPIMPRFQL
jgi:hypothetical protein